jgi:CDP-diacylglycerol--serine O-phosphatidyltransferase
MSQDNLEKITRRRGMIFLPNAITTAAMLSGFYSIQQSITGRFDHAAWALLLAAVLDMLDGRVARLTKSTSEFGEQYDSLADLISFGVAPAFLAFYWGLQTVFGELAWAVVFIYPTCAAIRLARFNVLTGSEESRKFFKGMPSPCAAGIPVIPVMVYLKYFGQGALTGSFAAGIYLVSVIVGALLMVSNIRFRTFKEINFTRYGMAPALAGLAVILSLLLVYPQATLFASLIAYLVLGIVEGGILYRMKEAEERKLRKELKKQERKERRLERRARRKARLRAVVSNVRRSEGSSRTEESKTKKRERMK